MYIMENGAPFDKDDTRRTEWINSALEQVLLVMPLPSESLLLYHVYYSLLYVLQPAHLAGQALFSVSTLMDVMMLCQGFANHSECISPCAMPFVSCCQVISAMGCSVLLSSLLVCLCM